MSTLQKISIPPGLRRLGTVYDAMGRWYDATLVRWVLGVLQPIGGWAQRTTGAMTGKARAGMAWIDNNNTRLIVIGTHSKLYALTQTGTTPSDITPVGFTAGDADATNVGGYGAGAYGAGTYGTPRADVGTIQEASMWTMDSFGQNWYGLMPQDGNLYTWDRNTSNKATVVAGAPTGSAVVVTPERFLVVLGAGGDNRLAQWADQESDSDWTPGATDQAGSLRVESFGRLMCGKRIRGGTLLWTDVDVHLMSYVGQPFIYRIDRVGENCGICSRGAAIVADTRAIWMGQDAFYAFDGGIVTPLDCEVDDAVFGDINTNQRSKVIGFHNVEFQEAWWFYPGQASTEIDRAVVFNYAEGWWTLHTLTRTCAIARGVFNNPMMVDGSGYIWDHESGFGYNSEGTPYAESGPIELGNGDRRMRVRRFIADEKTEGDVQVTFKTRDWPNDTTTSYGPYDPANPTTSRFSGRQVMVRVTGDQLAGWRWGVPRLELHEGGKR